ncbi:MAG: D-amino-acid transaminase [Bacillota bacterium]
MRCRLGELVYLNGEYLQKQAAVVSVEDRAFLFGDGIYEVVRVYKGRPFLLERHLDRLVSSAAKVSMPLDQVLLPLERLGEVVETLIQRNEIKEGTVYIQVTRGAARRSHAFPPECKPTMLVMTYATGGRSWEAWTNGVQCITSPDDRWARCDIKSVNLLPNVLAKQRAAERGCYEAIFVRDGFLMEGSSSNFFAVRNGTVVTPPLTNYILPGITRGLVIELCRDAGIKLVEAPVHYSELERGEIQEVFLTGTNTEVVPVVGIDGKAVGDAKPGPVTRAVQRAFSEYVDRVAGGGCCGS